MGLINIHMYIINDFFDRKARYIKRIRANMVILCMYKYLYFSVILYTFKTTDY